MFKKLLAGLTTIVLSLGLVALTAAPASAHHNTIKAEVSCNTGPEGTWKVTWTVKNSEDRKETITESNDTSIVPVGTEIAKNATLTVVRYYTTKPSSDFTLRLSAEWSNRTTNTSYGTLEASAFKNDCLPDETETKKVDICHANEGNGWSSENVSVNSIIKNNGHGGHSGDIIPPFTYVKHGVQQSYPGKNWDAYGQAVFASGCAEPKVTPAAAIFTEAVCDASGDPGQASYVIPATTGVVYSVKVGNGDFAVAPAGTYFVNPGTRVDVKATAEAGYQLTGPDTWGVTFANLDCIDDVIPIAPTWTEAVCTGEQNVGPASFVIPAVEGVQYYLVSGIYSLTPIAAGVHEIVDGSLVRIHAAALPGYEFDGADFRLYMHLFDNFDESKDCLVPVPPTFDPQECTAPGESSQASYTIPSDTGVKYQLWDGGAWTSIAAGTYDIDAFPTTVQLRAIPKSGYSFLPGAVTTWTEEFAAADDCTATVAVEPAVAVAESCVVDIDTEQGSKVSGWITIPGTAGVDYFIDGVPAPAGKNELAPGTYEITAAAKPGYSLTGYAGAYEVTIAAALPCGLQTLPSVVAVVTFTQSTCVAPATYTLAVDPMENAAGVEWTVSGGLPDTLGTHSVDAAQTVTITAKPAQGYGFGDGKPGTVREWSFDVTAPSGDCLPTLELPTLALTGGGIAGGALGLAALLAGAGILLVARRRDRVTAEQ